MKTHTCLFQRCPAGLLFGAVGLLAAITTGALAEGNPLPGFPHDTVILHVLKGESGPKHCDGGNSLFIRHYGGVIPETTLTITMTDWEQVDNDNDGRFDEDGPNGIDDDGDGLIDEDGVEPGAETKALDCDAWVADPSTETGTLALQIRDTDPRKGYVSVQSWFLRLIGKPEQNFAFTTAAGQTQAFNCVVNDPDGIPASGDEYVTCEYVDVFVPLGGTVNLAEGGCVKQVKLGGKNLASGGGKTPFCDISSQFYVDVDQNGDGLVDLPGQFIFSVSCLDDPLTEINESLYCPLSSLIWQINPDQTTSQATAQIFVSHTGSASVKSGRIIGGAGQ